LHIEVPLSAKRQFQLFCSEHFPGLADIIDCLALTALSWEEIQLALKLKAIPRIAGGGHIRAMVAGQ
jgi:hypothetical protein